VLRRHRLDASFPRESLERSSNFRPQTSAPGGAGALTPVRRVVDKWVEVVLLDREEPPEHVEMVLEWAEGDGKRASGRARIPHAPGRMPRDRGRPGRGPERGAGRAREAHDHDGIERTVGYPGIPGSNGDRQRSPIHFQVKRAGDEHVPAVATFEEEKGMRRDLERVRERPRRAGWEVRP